MRGADGRPRRPHCTLFVRHVNGVVIIFHAPLADTVCTVYDWSRWAIRSDRYAVWTKRRSNGRGDHGTNKEGGGEPAARAQDGRHQVLGRVGRLAGPGREALPDDGL